jgi:hypothetical protein
MTRPIISILDTETQELIVREMNDAEYAQHLIDVANWEIEEAIRVTTQLEANAAAEAKKAAKAEALAALGLSQEVVNLLAE